jgi:hypothetical protein
MLFLFKNYKYIWIKDKFGKIMTVGIFMLGVDLGLIFFLTYLCFSDFIMYSCIFTNDKN